MVKTARVTLVTVIGAFELEERLLKDMTALGVKAYTLGKVSGRGAHGRRTSGFVDAPNMRREMLVPPALSHKILECIGKGYDGQPIMAYVHEVDAIPAERFG